MSSSFGISPVSGAPRTVRSYGAAHLLAVGAIGLVCGLIVLVRPGMTLLALVSGVMLLPAGRVERRAHLRVKQYGDPNEWTPTRPGRDHPSMLDTHWISGRGWRHGLA